MNNSPHSLLGLCDFDNKHLRSDIKEKKTLNTRVNEQSAVLHQKNSHCVDELSYNSYDEVNNNSCNNIVSERSTNHNFSTASLNFHMSLDKILKNTNTHDNDNTQDSECDLIMPSPYFNDETLISSLKTKSQNFSIYSLNCQSLKAKINQIELKIEYLRENGVEFSVICLQETWLSDDSDTFLLQIDGYQLLSQGKTCTSHRGLAIFLNNNFNFIHSRSYVKSTIWEPQFTEIPIDRKCKRKLVLGNVYRPPGDLNENYQTLIGEFAPVLYDLQKRQCEVVRAGDYNIDLLKVK